MHPAIKSVLTRHSTMQDAVQKLMREVQSQFSDRETEINNQRRNLPRIMDRSAFAIIGRHITHEAIKMIMQQWTLAKRMAIDVADGTQIKLEEGCFQDCDLPMQYRLPCKCWLYHCVVMNVPIPFSLIHPRWLLDGPPYVSSWQMAFDLDSDADANADVDSSSDSDSNILLASPKKKTSKWVQASLLLKSNCAPLSGVSSAEDISDKYQKKGEVLMEDLAVQSMNFQSTIENSHDAEKYAREWEKTMTKFNKVWQEKESSKRAIATTIPDPFSNQKNLKCKSGASRK